MRRKRIDTIFSRSASGGTAQGIATPNKPRAWPRSTGGVVLRLLAPHSTREKILLLTKLSVKEIILYIIERKGKIPPDNRRIFRRLGKLHHNLLRIENIGTVEPCLLALFMIHPSAKAAYRQTIGGFSAVWGSCITTYCESRPQVLWRKE